MYLRLADDLLSFFQPFLCGFLLESDEMSLF